MPGRGPVDGMQCHGTTSTVDETTTWSIGLLRPVPKAALRERPCADRCTERVKQEACEEVALAPAEQPAGTPPSSWKKSYVRRRYLERKDQELVEQIIELPVKLCRLRSQLVEAKQRVQQARACLAGHRSG